MGLTIISIYTIGLCLLYIPIYTCTSIYTYINMVYDLLGRSNDDTSRHKKNTIGEIKVKATRIALPSA